jgi:hypothetical protein
VERYKNAEASVGKAGELAGLPLGQMMTIRKDFGVESRRAGSRRKTTSKGFRISRACGDYGLLLLDYRPRSRKPHGRRDS